MKPFGSTKKAKSKSVTTNHDLALGKVTKGTIGIVKFLTEHSDKVLQ